MDELKQPHPADLPARLRAIELLLVHLLASQARQSSSGVAASMLQDSVAAVTEMSAADPKVSTSEAGVAQALAGYFDQAKSLRAEWDKPAYQAWDGHQFPSAKRELPRRIE